MHHIAYYDPHGGRDNERRLIGANQTETVDAFSSGVADREASVRIPRQVFADKCVSDANMWRKKCTDKIVHTHYTSTQRMFHVCIGL